MKRNPSIAFIGAGRIAHSLLPALLDAGYKIETVCSRKITSAKKLARSYGIKNYSSYITAASASDVVFIAVPDDSIGDVAKEISKRQKNLLGKIFIHLSGSAGLRVLSVLRKKGAATASMHLMQTFPSRRRVQLRNVYALIECGRESEKYFAALVKRLGLIRIFIKPESKTLYHMLGVFVSNFMVADFFAAELLSDKINYSGSLNIKNLLSPIAQNTLKNIEDNSLIDSLSGPVIRGDYKIIQKHISELNKLIKKRSVNVALFLYLSGCLVLLDLIKNKKGKLTNGQLRISELLLMEFDKSWRQVYTNS